MSKERKKGGFGKFLLGAGVGATLGLLFAPKKGSETRRELKAKLDEFIGGLKEIDTDDLKETFHNKIDEIKKELEDLDREKVVKIAKEKANELKNHAEKLLALAKEKGTPILEKAAKEVKEKTADAIREILKKLEAE